MPYFLALWIVNIILVSINLYSTFDFFISLDSFSFLLDHDHSVTLYWIWIIWSQFSDRDNTVWLHGPFSNASCSIGSLFVDHGSFGYGSMNNLIRFGYYVNTMYSVTHRWIRFIKSYSMSDAILWHVRRTTHVRRKYDVRTSYVSLYT